MESHYKQELLKMGFSIFLFLFTPILITLGKNKYLLEYLWQVTLTIQTVA